MIYDLKALQNQCVVSQQQVFLAIVLHVTCTEKKVKIIYTTTCKTKRFVLHVHDLLYPFSKYSKIYCVVWAAVSAPFYY